MISIRDIKTRLPGEIDTMDSVIGVLKIKKSPKLDEAIKLKETLLKLAQDLLSVEGAEESIGSETREKISQAFTEAIDARLMIVESIHDEIEA